jgi:hypothetical protein
MKLNDGPMREMTEINAHVFHAALRLGDCADAEGRKARHRGG